MRTIFYSNGSVGVDYVVTFNNATGVSTNLVQQEIVAVLNRTNNGTFLGDSNLKISNENDTAALENSISFQGKPMFL